MDERFSRIESVERSHRMTLACYKITNNFPKHELFGLASQIRRCSSSIPANIAEGCGRMGNSEFHRFLQMACGSANELEYHLLLARDLGYMGDGVYEAAQSELLDMKRMLVAFTRKVGSERKQ